uniref:Putative ixodegrin protein n=1 Tax=Ixodes ricinus TaxID=34613 RepID=A0A0K8RJT4_IXORI
MNAFIAAVVLCLLLTTFVIPVSSGIYQATNMESGQESVVQDRECSNRDDCNPPKCCQNQTRESDMITVSCYPNPDPQKPCPGAEGP